MIELYGIIFTIFIGALLHFTYEWSGRSLLMAFSAPTNESVFEHLKLLMTPFLLWTLNEYVHYGQFMKNFIPAKTIGLIAGVIFIIVFFYVYTTVCGRNFLVIDIAAFVFSVLIAFGLSHYLMTVPWLGLLPVRLVCDLLLICLVLVTAAFSIYPPRSALFDAPPLRKPRCK